MKTQQKRAKANVAFIAGLVATAGIVTASASQAGPGGFGKHGERPSFEQLDTDGNGEISKAELENRGAARFATADSNGDGKLTVEEMIAASQNRAQDRAAKMVKKFDTNGDGALSQDELPKPRHAGKMFERIDADGSGGISAEEFAEAKDRMRGHRKHKGNDQSTDQN
ncbi:MAG: calcium-binding protein [Rhodobacteraceae bacterium]|nr:calcium-binding protein [Paracoccaceae bacterium]